MSNYPSEDDAGIPTVPAYRIKVAPGYWFVWCPHCRDEHAHIGLGRREAKCKDPNSPYKQSGYVLIAATEHALRRAADLPWRRERDQREQRASRAAAKRWLARHGIIHEGE
jgi:hypothetical protein